MEDLATDRIYRLMIAIRARHGSAAQVMDDDGKVFVHTRESVSRIFDEELARIVRELPPGSDPSLAETYRRARVISENMIVRGEFNPI